MTRLLPTSKTRVYEKQTQLNTVKNHVKAIFSEGYTETTCIDVYFQLIVHWNIGQKNLFAVNGFTENKGKNGKGAIPDSNVGRVLNAHLPSSGHWARRWIPVYRRVCYTMPHLRLPSQPQNTATAIWLVLISSPTDGRMSWRKWMVTNWGNIPLNGHPSQY